MRCWPSWTPSDTPMRTCTGECSACIADSGIHHLFVAHSALAFFVSTIVWVSLVTALVHMYKQHSDGSTILKSAHCSLLFLNLLHASRIQCCVRAVAWFHVVASAEVELPVLAWIFFIIYIPIGPSIVSFKRDDVSWLVFVLFASFFTLISSFRTASMTTGTSTPSTPCAQVWRLFCALFIIILTSRASSFPCSHAGMPCFCQNMPFLFTPFTSLAVLLRAVPPGLHRHCAA